jgi:hypothetical protein
MPYPNCNCLDDAQLAFQHHQSRQINELTANVRQLMVLVQARAEMSPVPGQSYEYGAGASFIPEFGVASGRDFIFRPRYGDGLPLQHCVPWSAKENGACNGTTTGGLSNANGGRYEPPRMNTLFTAAPAADYPMDGQKKLVSPAAEVAPDTGAAPAGPHNSQKGNSGGFNGFSLFRSHKKHCSINKEEVSLDEYIRCMSTFEGAARNKKSVNVVGELAQQLKNKGQKGANAFLANQWKDLPDEEKAIYKCHASYIKNVKRAVDKKCQIVSKI